LALVEAAAVVSTIWPDRVEVGVAAEEELVPEGSFELLIFQEQ